MCVPVCTQKMAADLGRRNFLRSAAGLATVAALAGCAPVSATPPVGTAAAARSMSHSHSFSRIFDLTHTLAPSFPTFGGDPQLELETLVTLANDGYNLYRWLLNEHTGTHMDAPFHFSEGLTADQIPVEDWMGPLSVVDIRAKAEGNPDAQLTPDDLLDWESQHGPLPEGAIVAMNSGWDAFVGDERFRNADADGGMHFPGFHIEAIELLLGERSVKGIFVDTLSLDFGQSPDFAVHYRWLPANRWGIECVANLGQLPASGAIAIVGGPKIAGATGGPSRILALG